ncbi:MAG: hypothetical protein SNJ63_00550 [Sphingomonadaceae bacterium]
MANEWRPALLALAIAISGCAVSKEARVRQVLADAGVTKPTATCMAKIIADNLTNEQLRDLAEAAKLSRVPVGQITLDQAFSALRRVGDPEVIGTLALASTNCVGRI